MIEPVQVLWSPAGASMPTLGTRALVDVTDGDTPNVRMPIRMLSVDTPEVTAGTDARAAAIDAEFLQLAAWIRDGTAPITGNLAEHVLPRLETGAAGTLHLAQGRDASAFVKTTIDGRLSRPGGGKRSLFIRTADTAFDGNHRLLAYIAPNYTPAELDQLTRAQRSTFNLDLITAGWAAPFVIYPAIPGELDLPLLVAAAHHARTTGLGIWADPHTLLAYEYRAVEKLYRITKKKAAGQASARGEAYSWRERYCADMRTRVLHGPEDYTTVQPEYRLFIWPADLRDAVSRLNLTPSPQLTAPPR